MKLIYHLAEKYGRLSAFFGLSAVCCLLHANPSDIVDSDSIHSRTLREVNVVSMKQGTDIMNQAVSATILTRSSLEELGTVSIKGISDVVPNFYIPDYGSRITSSIYVRGIGARMDQPAVGLNVDNVPYLNKDAYDFDISDIASVEMLRGPQSTLYGRNTMGGVISITTLSPMRFQGWRIMAEAANGNSYRASLSRYMKFNSSVASSLSLALNYTDGFFKNQYNGRKIDKDRSGSARWKMEWRPSADLYVRNAFSASLLRQGGYPYEYKESGRIEYNDTCFYRRFTLADGLTVSLRKPSFTMTSITSVQHIDDNMTLDQDFLPKSFFTLTQKKKETGFTEDLVFKGIDRSEGYNWLAGFFGFYKHLDMQAPVTFKDDGIRQLIESHRNDSNPDYPIAWDERSFVLNSDFILPTWGVALYHESKYSLGQWLFTAGLRLDLEQSSLRYNSRCNTSYTIYKRDGSELNPYRNIPIDIDDKGRMHRTYLNWMPKLTVLYRLPETVDGNIYFNFSKGYKSGGYNTQMFSDVLQQRLMGIMGIGAQYDIDQVTGYRPEYSWNYELGSHLSFLDDRLTADISLFFIDCRDQQLTMFPDGTTTGRIMANAGKTRSFGGELAMSYRPARWVDLSFSYGFTDARFVKFFDGRKDYKGKYIPYAPRNTLFLQSLFFVDVKSKWMKKFTFDLNLRGVGKIFWNEDNTESQDFYLLPGASIMAEGKKWSLQIWGKNLSSTRYHTFYFLSMGNAFFQVGKPLQVGATLRFDI